MDAVRYDDTPPWPDADGNGLALRRVDNNSFANDPANWEAVLPVHPPAGEGEGEDPLQDPVALASALLEVLVAVDTDEDGMLSAAEVMVFYDALTPAQFATLDTNGDQLLSPSELAAAAGTEGETEGEEAVGCNCTGVKGVKDVKKYLGDFLLLGLSLLVLLGWTVPKQR